MINQIFDIFVVQLANRYCFRLSNSMLEKESSPLSSLSSLNSVIYLFNRFVVVLSFRYVELVRLDNPNGSRSGKSTDDFVSSELFGVFQSFDALEFVRKDLSEFTTTVKSDLTKLTTQPVKPTENLLRPSPPIDRLQSEKFRLENDETTYLSGTTHNEFNAENRKNEIAQILIDSPHVRAMYTRLVPTATSHAQFWSRYFHHLSVFQGNEERRSQLLKRAEEICQKNENSSWDDPEDESSEPNVPAHAFVSVSADSLEDEWESWS